MWSGSALSEIVPHFQQVLQVAIVALALLGRSSPELNCLGVTIIPVR